MRRPLALIGVLFASFAFAAPTLDGTLSFNEYGSVVKHVSPYVNGADASGGVQEVDLYFSSDATHYYGAVVGDPGTPSLPSVNLYLYNSFVGEGVYGDGDDLLVHGINNYGFALNFDPWITVAHTFAAPTILPNGVKLVSDPGKVSVAFNEAELVYEWSVLKSLVNPGGAYPRLRYGGQLFGYEFVLGGGSRMPGALVTFPESQVPEPSTVSLMLGGLVFAGAMRLRKK